MSLHVQCSGVFAPVCFRKASGWSIGGHVGAVIRLVVIALVYSFFDGKFG